MSDAGARRTAGWTLAAVAGAGVVATTVVAVVLGMRGGEIATLLALMAPAMAITLAGTFVARRILSRASLRRRFVAVALVAALVAIAHLAILSRAMFVSEHDARVLVVLLAYAAGVGVAAALLIAKGTGEALERLEDTATRLGDGDLGARVGELRAGRELDRLATTLDEMAGRLQRARAREREGEQMRRDLITTISHDLRTPLASLRAMVEAIDDGVVDDGPTMRRYAYEMRRSVEQLVAMVDDLFELTQLDAGAIAAETQRASLGELVRDAVATVQLHASEKDLRVVEDLGAAEAVRCSPRLGRVLQNLLVNAVRHTPAEGTVTVAAALDGDRLLLDVRDTGEGIAPEHLTQVFEPFFRADPARSGAGAGLGLALAKRIVEALGGAIRAESDPGWDGARFRVELPVPTPRVSRPA